MTYSGKSRTSAANWRAEARPLSPRPNAATPSSRANAATPSQRPNAATPAAERPSWVTASLKKLDSDPEWHYCSAEIAMPQPRRVIRPPSVQAIDGASAAPEQAPDQHHVPFAMMRADSQDEYAAYRIYSYEERSRIFREAWEQQRRWEQNAYYEAYKKANPNLSYQDFDLLDAFFELPPTEIEENFHINSYESHPWVKHFWQVERGYCYPSYQMTTINGSTVPEHMLGKF